MPGTPGGGRASGLRLQAELKNVSPARIQKAFTQSPEGTYTVRPEILGLVDIRLHNPLTAPPMQDFDLILCRNVVIYIHGRGEVGAVQAPGRRVAAWRRAVRVSSLRAISRAAILLYVVGFVPYSLSPFFPAPVVTLGEAVAALGIIWLGWQLWNFEPPAEPVAVAGQIPVLATAGLNGE